MPQPKPFERQEDFINRCIPELIEKENMDREQATAVCYSYWNKK